MSNPVKRVQWTWDFDHRPTIKEVFELIGPDDIPDNAELYVIQNSASRGTASKFTVKAVTEQSVYKTVEDMRKENPL